MATWHQRQRPGKLYHETLYSVVIDPPNGCTAVVRYSTRGEAEQYLANVRARGERHAYILNPQWVTP